MLRIHTQIDSQTINYGLEAISKMIRLAENVDELEFNLYALQLNGAVTKQVDDFRIRFGLRDNQVTISYVEKPQKRSVGHGQAINAALATIVQDSDNINVLMDADSCVVARHWDVATRVLLTETNVSTFGTPYEDPGEFSSGTGNVQTYKGIPNVIWMGLRPGVPWHTLNAMPQKDHCPTLHGEDARIHGLNDGMQLLKDVGWAIPQFIHDHKLNYVTMLHTKPTKVDVVVLKPLDWDYHEEYHLFGVPFAVHQRGSTKFTFRQAHKSAPFYDAIDDYVTKIENEPVPDWREIILKGQK